MIPSFIIPPPIHPSFSRRFISFTSGSQLPSQRLQQGRLKAGRCLGKSTTSVTRIRKQEMRSNAVRFEPLFTLPPPLYQHSKSCSWSLSSPCLPLRVIIFSLIGGSQHLQSVSKSNGGQVALAVASHHGIIVQEPIFLGSSNPKGERKGWRRIGGETSRRSEFIVPDLIENLPLGKSKFLPGSFFFFVDLERMRVDVVMGRGKEGKGFVRYFLLFFYFWTDIYSLSIISFPLPGFILFSTC